MTKNKRSTERGRGQGRARRGRWPGPGPGPGPGWSFRGGRMTGPPRRGPLRVNAQPSSHTIAKSYRTNSSPWQRDLFEDVLRSARLAGVENGTKLYISNLDVGVNNEDIRVLFSEIGQLKRYAVHYDQNGRSSGSAEVEFVQRSYAFQALKRYNNVLLDGKPMKIAIIGTNSGVPVSTHVTVVGGANGRSIVMRPGVDSRGGSVGFNRGFGQRSRGSFRNGRGGGGLRNLGGNYRGRGRGGGSYRGRGGGGVWKKVEKSAYELDKDLDNYQSGAMHT